MFVLATRQRTVSRAVLIVQSLLRVLACTAQGHTVCSISKGIMTRLTISALLGVTRVSTRIKARYPLWFYGGVGYALLKADFAHGTANAIITGSVVNDSSSAGELCLECASIKNFGYGVFSNSASSRWTVRNTVFSNLFRDMQVSGTVHYFNVTPSAAGIPGPASIGEKFFYTRLNGDKAQNGVWTSVAAWATATDQRHTASGVAWKVSTTTTCYAYSPVSLTVA